MLMAILAYPWMVITKGAVPITMGETWHQIGPSTSVVTPLSQPRATFFLEPGRGCRFMVLLNLPIAQKELALSSAFAKPT